MKKTAKAKTIYQPNLLETQYVKSYMEKIVGYELERAMIRRFTKKLKTMSAQLARHLINKYDVTIMTQPDLKSNKEIILIKLDDKNLYKLMSK